VLVAAGNDYVFKGFSGGVAIAVGEKGAAVSPGVYVGVIDNTTKAYIGPSARVSARADVHVEAYASEEILSLAVAIAGTVAEKGAGVAGAVMVVDLEATTYAYVDANASVDAGGNVSIAAADRTELDTILGSLGFTIGKSGAGLGASVGVASLSKDTRAYIGANAKVNARGNSVTNLRSYNGQLDSSGFGRTAEDVHGLVVEAYSSEDVWTLLIAGAAALTEEGFALAGTVDVLTIDSDTQAYIAGGAVINGGDNSSAGDKQDVVVSAVNKVKFRSILGSLGVSLGGIAGAVDVGAIRNDTSAYIAGTVNARRDVHVNALANRDIETVVVSVGIGGIGIAASVGVYSAGGNLQDTYSSEGKTGDPLKGSDGATTSDYADDQKAQGKTGITNMLDSNNDPNNDPGTNNTPLVQGKVAAASTKMKNTSLGSSASSTLGANVIGETRTLPRGTAAFIAENATVNAGRHVDVDARERITLNVKIGGVGVGAVGVGAGVGIVTTDSPVTATIGAGASVSAGTVDKSGEVRLDAQLHTTVDVTAFVGTYSASYSLGAAVAVVSDDSDVSAYVAADSLGIQGVMIGAVRNNATTIAEILGLPEYVYCVFGMCLGYPAEAPKQKPRMDQDLVVHREHYEPEKTAAAVAAYDPELRAHYEEIGKATTPDSWSHDIDAKFHPQQREGLRSQLKERGFDFR